MVTICPYKLVLLAVTVIFAALVAWNQGTGTDDSDAASKNVLEEEEDEDGTEQTWETWWNTPWFRAVKTKHPVAYKTCYTVCIALLVVFHFEVFSGGLVCRYLFAPDGGLASGANSTIGAAASAITG
eukprot:m.106819 g.106819  ORF g.106819 m.106819 type:complete len:127 (-) comp21114_c0_seq1:151-531(-)